ncbi:MULTISPECIES: MerR family transcriptional regulator [Kribbella]|uniref:MerR family transcriptional regulator n=2 Tax=Kribbella TaxID=182639 RepID=A0A4R0J2W8_9ACTN|nr:MULTISPECIES: MerR family transcriptional regulator [Kribbella]TCC23416.1 MerR family transcriptional regulator [Kribbella speibonae]TCC32564.1 MerR family transcriptional regulator [Kribbella sindirgiensis]TCC38536.1 MerR family transcriptional regulator [Kribbella speibonae]
MNATELLVQAPIDRELLCLLELPEDLPEQLSIAEASELTGLTAHTLRYYERIGLLDVRRDSAGYRSYDRRAMARIVFISRLRASGMPIGTISHYLELVLEGDHTEPQRLALMQEHRDRIQRQLRDLQLALAVTDYKITVYGGTAAP